MQAQCRDCKPHYPLGLGGGQKEMKLIKVVLGGSQWETDGTLQLGLSDGSLLQALFADVWEDSGKLRRWREAKRNSVAPDTSTVQECPSLLGWKRCS